MAAKNTSFAGLEFFTDVANEETNLFNRRPSWNLEDSLDEKYLEFLVPHSKAYFSRLRPIHSFEIKGLESLNSFSHVLLRDGLIFLLRFFHRFPMPGELQTKIFVHEDLAFTVPESWQNQILLYSSVSYFIPRERKNLIVCLNLHEEQRIENLKELLGPHWSKREELFILPFYNTMRGEDYYSYDRTNTLGPLKDLVPSHGKIVNLSDLTHLDAQDTEFINANPQKVYWSDSNLDHNWLRHGLSSPLIKSENELSGDYGIVSLSPYHGMTLRRFRESEAQGRLRARLFNELKFPEGPLFQNEPSFNRSLEDYYKIFYFSSGLLQLAKELGHEMARGLLEEKVKKDQP